MKCAVLQPSYIPWKGYFHQIQKADVFVFYDDVAFDSSGWRNRNRIKTAAGPVWLTVPVNSKNHLADNTLLKDIRINWNRFWNRKHWESIRQAYGKAPFFERYAPALEPLFSARPEFLAELTMDLTRAIAPLLGLTGTRFVRSSDFAIGGKKTDRLVRLLQKVGADHYISGPSAKEYLEEEKLAEAGIRLEYMSYDYPEYRQLYPPYEPQVSVLDLLFMAGPEAPDYIWNTSRKPRNENMPILPRSH